MYDMTIFDVPRYREKPTLIAVDDTVLHTMAEGLGFNWASWFPPKTFPAADDETRWARIFAHADWLNVQYLRFSQHAKDLADTQGNFRPGHGTFDQLRRVDAWATQRNVSLILDPWVVPAAFCYEPWPGAPTEWGVARSKVLTGVRDVDGYVDRFVVPYVRHAVQEMGCRSIRWFNMMNEPLLGHRGCTPPGVDDHVRLAEALVAIKQGLREAGLGHIGNMGPDTSTHMYWPIPRMIAGGCDPDPGLDAYCMHQYHSYFDWAPPVSGVLSTPMSESIRQLRMYCDYAHARGKPYLVTELGMFYYGRGTNPAGVRRHDNVILEADFIVRGLREGADAFLRWGWLDPGTRDGYWQLVETADGSDKPVTNPYRGYGTLMRYLNRGASLLESRVETDPPQPHGTIAVLHAAAFRNTDGSRSLLVVNSDYCQMHQVRLQLPEWSDGLRKIVYDADRKHVECDAPAAGSTGEVLDTLTPMSLTVYTTSTRHD